MLAHRNLVISVLMSFLAFNNTAKLSNFGKIGTLMIPDRYEY